MVDLLGQSQGFGRLARLDFHAHRVHRDVRRSERRPADVAFTGSFGQWHHGPYALPSCPDLSLPDTGDRTEQRQRAAQRRGVQIARLHVRSKCSGRLHREGFRTLCLVVSQEHMREVPLCDGQAMWIIGGFGRPDRPVRHEQREVDAANPLGDRAQQTVQIASTTLHLPTFRSLTLALVALFGQQVSVMSMGS